MTTEELNQLFEKHNDEFLKGDIEGPRDLAAILRLQSIAPVTSDVVSASEHDQFWLAHKEEAVAANATEEDVIFLVRCGLMYDEGEGFSFFS